MRLCPSGRFRGIEVLDARYYDPQTGQFLDVDPKFQQTLEAFLYAGDDPVNATDPSGMGGSGLLLECAFRCPNVRSIFAHAKYDGDLFSVIEHVSADVAHFVATHKVVIGVALGVLSVATGGVGFAADLAFEGTFLTTTVADVTAAVSGTGATILDEHSCHSGDEVACVGRDLGVAGSLSSVAAVYGDVTDVAAGTIRFGVLKGISAAGLTFGIASTLTDAMSRLAGRQ